MDHPNGPIDRARRDWLSRVPGALLYAGAASGAAVTLAPDAAEAAAPLPPPAGGPTDSTFIRFADERERFFGHLGQTLDEIDFHKGRAPEMEMARLRRLFLRAAMDTREVKILRGILSEAQRMARLARGPGA